MAGIMHFANYYKFMEETEHAYFRSLGLSIMHHLGPEQVIGWPRVSTQCTYEAPSYYDDLLQVHLNVERIGVKSVTYQLEFYRAGKRTAHGRMKTACCICKAQGKLESIPIPPPYSDKLVEAGSLGIKLPLSVLV
jgi:YbgC/YbaW family acyl-CoA thioester hydrolase